MMYEDVDFSWRAWLAGYKVASARESIVYHFRGGIIGQNFRNFKNMYIRNTARNHLITLLKNYEPLNAFLSYPMAALLILVESAYVFVRIDRRKGLAGIMGVLESFWRIPNTIASRVTIQENRQICDRELMHVMHRFSPAFLMSNSILLAENGRRNLPKTEVDLRFDDE